MITEDDLQNWFTYHSPSPEKNWRLTEDTYLTQAERYEAIRNAGYVMAKMIVAMTPSSADQTVAIRKIREAVMVANASIACGGH
jgi:hypothetical protein